MNPLLLDLDPKSFWNGPNGSSGLLIAIILMLIVGVGLIFGLLQAPPQLRRPIVAAVTFVSGLFYVLFWLFPTPISRSPGEMPRGIPESISFWLDDAQPVVTNISNIVSGFMIGLGVFSILSIHIKKISRQQKDWSFSLVLVVCLFSVAILGFWDWAIKQSPAGAGLSSAPSSNWGFVQYAKDLLFDGFLQQMDAAMFSLIAFYILSAAYRAFRARSIEATVLLISALLMILSFMGLVQNFWDSRIIDGTGIAFLKNFRLDDISTWMRSTLQNSSIRGLDFGVGIGLLAMALRLWLSREKIGSEA